MPAVRRRLAREVLEQVSEGEVHARKAIELLEGLGPLPDAAEARRLRAIGHQHASLSALERMTEIATLHIAEIEPQVATSCDVASVAEGVVLIMRPEAERVAELHMVIGAAPSVIMDQAALGCVLVTLLSDAIDSVQDQPRGKITVEVGTDTGEAVVRVSAEGCEADEEQLESAARASSEVGLSVACELVERAGGTTTTIREPGYGVSFEVRLPIESPDGDPPSVLTWGPFRVDLISNRVQVDAWEVPGLQPLQVRLLAHFVQNVGRVSTHQELLKRSSGLRRPCAQRGLPVRSPNCESASDSMPASTS